METAGKEFFVGLKGVTEKRKGKILVKLASHRLSFEIMVFCLLHGGVSIYTSG
jgi:hypothetical protein